MIQSIFNRALPFLVMAVLLLLGIAAFVLLSYVLFWIVLVGAVWYAVAAIKNKYFPRRDHVIPDDNNFNANTTKRGRVIDHDDIS